MRSLFRFVLCALFIASCPDVFSQNDRKIDDIKNDPDWKIILENNIDFINRLTGNSQNFFSIWSEDRSKAGEKLGYSHSELDQRYNETKDAARRLLAKYPALRDAKCDNCELTEAEMIRRTDQLVGRLKAERVNDVGMYFQAIEDDEEIGDTGPKCGWKFYACVAICAATIEFFPGYLACCAFCLCQYCTNPPAWCQ